MTAVSQKTVLVMCLFSIALLTISTSEAQADFNFDDFASTDGLNLGGDAMQDGNVLM